MTARSTPIPVGALDVDPRGCYLRGMHIERGFLSGGLQLGGVISGVNLQGGYLRHSDKYVFLRGCGSIHHIDILANECATGIA